MHIQELGHVVLYVTNVERVADFYRDTLGFEELQRSPGLAVFSSGRTHHELLLIEVGGEPRPQNPFQPGLYHIGFKIGDGPDILRSVYKELREKGVKIVGSADHTVTHSLYIEDPDGNVLELYADVSEGWKTNPLLILSPAKPLTFKDVRE